MVYKPFSNCSDFFQIIKKINQGNFGEVDNSALGRLTAHLLDCRGGCSKKLNSEAMGALIKGLPSPEE